MYGITGTRVFGEIKYEPLGTEDHYVVVGEDSKVVDVVPICVAAFSPHLPACAHLFPSHLLTMLTSCFRVEYMAYLRSF